ncbi:hypothetical protein A3749_02000, partial [Oleiphilus sp. HI0078]
KSATSRLTDPQALITLHAQSKDELKPLIEEKLYELANAQSLSIFDLITDNKILTQMIIKSNQADAFLSGLARIEDKQSLLEIAVKAKMAKLRQAAAELIETEADLSTLLSQAKGKDKSVYHIAKSKLATIRNQIAERSQQQQDIEKALADITALAKTEVLQHYDAKLFNLSKRWAAVSLSANETQRKEFAHYQAECQARIDKIAQEKLEAEEQERLIQTGGDEQEATLYTLSETLKRFTTEVPSFHDISAIDALIKTQENRWLEVTRNVKVEKNKAKHYQVLMSEIRQYYKALTLLKEAEPELKESIDELSKQGKKDSTQLDTLNQRIRKLLKQVNWPKDYAQPEVISQSNEALGHSAEIKQQVAENTKEIESKISQLVTQLDKSLEDKQLKKSNSLLKDIQRQISKLGSKQSDQYHNMLNLRINQLNDLRDWQGYASNPRQLALCESMERLVDTHIEPRDKADRIKAMQKEWKTLGGASDQSLWQRFKEAADKAYEPCHAFFDEQNQLKKNNSAKREQIITELSNFIDNNDWENADWKGAEKINRQARLEWKEAYPVDFKTNKPMQQQFNALLKAFDKKLDTERDKNLSLKQEIIDQAQTLIELENLEQAIQSAKDLQQAWQKVGITPYKKERELWQAFRAICDQIFARRDQVRNEKKEEANKASNAANELLSRIESELDSLSDTNLSELKARLSEYRKEYKSLPSVQGKALEKIQNRFEALLKKLKQLIAGQENRQHLLAWQEVQRKAKLCREVYHNNTQADASLDDEFASQLELPKAQEDTLKTLWISVKAGSVSPERCVTLQEARSLCIACEIAAGIESPESDKELRMQLQVSRLSEGMSSSGENLSREQQLSASLQKWYDSVGPTLEEFSQLEPRIDNTIQHLFAQ